MTKSRPRVSMLIGLGAAVLAACAPAASPSQEGAATNGCVEQSAVEFGALPLHSDVADTAVPEYNGTTNTCTRPVKLVESCSFQGSDGVTYSLFEGFVLNKTRPLPDQASTGSRLNLTNGTSREEVRRRLRKLGDDPVAHEGDGPPRLIVSLCPAETGSSWFEVWFDDAGRARGVELGSAP